jgi:hypothetical protein
MGATRWTWVNGHYRNQNGRRVWVRGHPRRLPGGPGADEVGAGLVAVIGFFLVLAAMMTPAIGSPPPEQREPIPATSRPASPPETEPPPEPIESAPPPEPIENEIPPEPTGTGWP